MQRIIYFTKYTDAAPSARYRSYQYFPYFENNRFVVIAKPLFPSKYVETLFKKGKKNVGVLLKQYTKRFWQLLTLNKNDILFIEYELFPFLPLAFEKCFLKSRKNVIIDYDDAVFHNYDKNNNFLIRKILGNKIYDLVKYANFVVTGNDYLTSSLHLYNENIVEIPTSIIYEKYDIHSSSNKQDKKFFRIGWIGSKTTSINLTLITESIKKLQKKSNIELALIGFDRSLCHILEGINYKIYEWSEEKEVEMMQSFDVGIMPLIESDFNRGKCGFKLIQYMGCGIPTISTPFTANVNINRNKKNLHASTTEEWLECFEKVLGEKEYYREIVGKENKDIVKQYYSVEANHSKYIRLFDQLMQQ